MRAAAALASASRSSPQGIGSPRRHSLEVIVGAGGARAHRGGVDRAGEALGEFALCSRAPGARNDFAGDVAPVEDGQLGHGAAFGLQRRQKPLDPAEPGEAALEVEPKPARRRLGFLRDRGIVGLREIDEPPVIAEIVVAQLRETVEPEAFDHQTLEMPREEIGEEERAGLRVHHLGEIIFAGIEGVAMRRRRCASTPSSSSTLSSSPAVPQSP